MPDRLPSLLVLVAFWIPPAIAGWTAAGLLRRDAPSRQALVTFTALTGLMVAYAGAWFAYNVGRMPPYIPGAVFDPTIATPQAVAGLVTFTAALILPGSLLACALAFWLRRRSQESGGASHAPA